MSDDWYAQRRAEQEQRLEREPRRLDRKQVEQQRQADLVAAGRALCEQFAREMGYADWRTANAAGVRYSEVFTWAAARGQR